MAMDSLKVGNNIYLMLGQQYPILILPLKEVFNKMQKCIIESLSC